MVFTLKYNTIYIFPYLLLFSCKFAFLSIFATFHMIRHINVFFNNSYLIELGTSHKYKTHTKQFPTLKCITTYIFAFLLLCILRTIDKLSKLTFYETLQYIHKGQLIIKRVNNGFQLSTRVNNCQQLPTSVN